MAKKKAGRYPRESSANYESAVGETGDSSSANAGSNAIMLVRDDDDAILQAWSELFNYNQACRVIKDTLEKCAKNYAGLFDEPKQRYTQRDKTFVNMTKWHCNGLAAKLKIDLAAMTVEPATEEHYAAAQLQDKVVHWQLRNMDFDEFLLKLGLETVVMGTGLVGVQWKHGKGVKNETIKLDPVSVLDIFTDPTVDTIQEDGSVSFIVKSVKDLWWVKNNPNFKNQDKVQPVTYLSRSQLARQDSLRLLPYKTSGYSSRSVATTGVSEVRWKSPKVVIYERWGKDYQTGEEYVTTIAGQTEGEAVCLRHKENPFSTKKRPFIEVWYRKEQGRWQGEGAAEILIPMQSAYNREWNTALDNAESLQNQMYKIRRGSGIDPRQLVSRPAGGILMENIETDLEPLPAVDIRGSFYKNDGLMRDIAQRLSGMFDISLGASTDASKTLGANVLEQRGATDIFEFTKRHMRGFLKRLLEMMVDFNMEFMDKETTIKITGDEEEIAAMDAKRGITPEQSKKLGKTRFLKIEDNKHLQGEFEIYVDIENALGVDKDLKIKQTMELIELAQKDPNSNIDTVPLYKDIFVLFGKDPNKYTKKPQQQQPGQPPNGMQPAPGATPTPQKSPQIPSTPPGVHPEAVGAPGGATPIQTEAPGMTAR